MVKVCLLETELQAQNTQSTLKLFAIEASH